MRKRAIFFGVFLFAISILTACAADQNGPDAQAVEHFNRGVDYQDQHKWDLAIEEYTKAIDLDPEYAKAYYNRGVVYWEQGYWEQGAYDRAISDFDMVIALDPENADAYNRRGIAYRDKGDDDRSIDDYDQAIALDPNFVQAYINRGLAYSWTGDLDRAIADFERALELGPEPAAKPNVEQFLEEWKQQK